MPTVMGRSPLSWAAVAFAVYHMYTALYGGLETYLQRALLVTGALALSFLYHPSGPKNAQGQRHIRAWDLVLAAASVAVFVYAYANYHYIVERFPYVHPLRLTDKILGALLVLLVLESTRRLLGPVLGIICLVFLGHVFVGSHLPGLFHHGGFDLETLLDQMFLTTEAIFGAPAGVVATYVILFIIFGAFLEKSGVGKFFLDFALSLLGRSPGGPAKMSVVSSSLFGTISGSAVANVVVDGWLTIPMMKRTGFSKGDAAAIEAVASTGGQIMPPIMGAAAFVMAEYMGVSYATVARQALLPAVLYYVALFATIHNTARRLGLAGLRAAEVPNPWTVMRTSGYLFAPVFIIIIALLGGYTATYAAMVATGGVLLVSYVRRDTRMRVSGILDALEEGTRGTLGVAAACAAAGIVIGVVGLTGLGARLTGFIVSIGHEQLMLSLVLTMATGLILGMGLPTTAAYILQAGLIIPALIQLGAPVPAAHMFVFYFACLSAITPPVALAVYTAAPIAGAGLWEAGLAAVKYGLAGFIVPFMFVYQPTLLLEGPVWEVALTAVTALIGTVFLAGAVAAWHVRPAGWAARLLLLVAALLLIKPGWATDLVGLILGGGVTVWQWVHSRSSAPLPGPLPVEPSEEGHAG